MSRVTCLRCVLCAVWCSGSKSLSHHQGGLYILNIFSGESDVELQHKLTDLKLCRTDRIHKNNNIRAWWPLMVINTNQCERTAQECSTLIRTNCCWTLMCWLCDATVKVNLYLHNRGGGSIQIINCIIAFVAPTWWNDLICGLCWHIIKTVKGACI